MSWSPLARSFMVSVAISAAACDRRAAPKVFSESVRLAEGRPIPDESAVSDGRATRLRGARGEILGVEVRSGGAPVRLVLPEAAARVSGFSVRSLAVRDPSTDMYGESTGPGAYPDVLVPSNDSVPSSDLAYFDVAIGPSAVPGRYRGELFIGNQRTEVVLDVSRARIDLSK